MIAPDPNAPPPPGATAQQNARYTYLVGRLRTRQITMEEATELFGLMQSLLRTSEQGRLALQRAAMAGAPPPPDVPASGARPRAPPASGSGDDLFLVGLLAMGAGAGLLAAMTKRLQELAPAAPAATPSRDSGR